MIAFKESLIEVQSDIASDLDIRAWSRKDPEMIISIIPTASDPSKTLAAAGGGGTGTMVPPLAREGGAILSFGPTFDVKGKR